MRKPLEAAPTTLVTFLVYRKITQLPLVINSFKFRPVFLNYSFLALTMTQSDIPAVAELFVSSCDCEL